jgi:membrane protease YdiL (CAAX protease family)
VARAARAGGADPAAALGSPQFVVLLFLGIFSPAFVALFMTARAEGRPGVVALLRRLVKWEVPARWYAFAIGYTIAVKLVTALAYRVASGSWPTVQLATLPLMLGATLLSLMLFGQLGEEVGWRGYALPRLGARMGLGWGSILLGALWAAWHLPLFYLPGADTYGQSFPLYLTQVSGISVAIAWLWARAQGSLLLTMLMHAAVNNTKEIVPAVARPAASPFVPDAPLLGWIGAGVVWAAAAYFLATMPKVAPMDAPVVSARSER